MALVALAFVPLTSTGFAQTPSMFAPSPFAIVPPVPPGINMGSMVVGDINSDGFPDVIIGSIGGASVGIYVCPGNGTATFSPPIVYPIAPNIPSLDAFCFVEATIDANGDGLLDLVATRNMTTTGPVPFGFSVLLNLGSLGFSAAPVLSSLMLLPSGYAVGDLDNDGGVDVVSAGAVTLTPSVSEIRVETVVPAASYGFIPVYSTTVNGWAGPVGIADINNDGLKDVLYQWFATGTSAYQVVVLPRTPSGGFGPPVTSSWPSQAGPNFFTYEFQVTDLNGDGYGDLVGFAHGSPYPPQMGVVATLLGTSSCSFVPGSVYQTTLTAGQITPPEGGACSLGDFDLDGVLELRVYSKLVRVQPAFGGTNVTHLDNSLLPNTFPLTAPPYYERAADVDLDGDLDIVQMNYATGQAASPTRLGVAINRTIQALGCGAVSLVTGTPTPGNPSYLLGISGAAPNAVAALGLSHSMGYFPLGSCVVRLGIAPGELILPYGNLGMLMTDATGSAQAWLSIPNVPALLGTDYFLQWLVVDPAGPVSVGGVNYALSLTRRIFMW